MNNIVKHPFHHRRLRKSFRYAIDGLIIIVNYHYNAQIMFILAGFAIILSLILGIESTQLLLVLLAIGLVFISEIFNTMVEEVTNLISEKKYHPTVKQIKDMSAAAVMIASLLSLVVAYHVFAGPLFKFLLP